MKYSLIDTAPQPESLPVSRYTPGTLLRPTEPFDMIGRVVLRAYPDAIITLDRTPVIYSANSDSVFRTAKGTTLNKGSVVSLEQTF